MSDPRIPPTKPDDHIDEAFAAESKRFDLLHHHLQFPKAYIWLLLFSALDVILTWRIFQLGGVEVNPLAEYVIFEWGRNGMIVYKFALVSFFILICEIVGVLREKTGRTLSRVSIVIAAFPVFWSVTLLTHYALNP